LCEKSRQNLLVVELKDIFVVRERERGENFSPLLGSARIPRALALLCIQGKAQRRNSPDFSFRFLFGANYALEGGWGGHQRDCHFRAARKYPHSRETNHAQIT
jgi:hypothetical protein